MGTTAFYGNEGERLSIERPPYTGTEKYSLNGKSVSYTEARKWIDKNLNVCRMHDHSGWDKCPQCATNQETGFVKAKMMGRSMLLEDGRSIICCPTHGNYVTKKDWALCPQCFPQPKENVMEEFGAGEILVRNSSDNSWDLVRFIEKRTGDSAHIRLQNGELVRTVLSDLCRPGDLSRYYVPKPVKSPGFLPVKCSAYGVDFDFYVTEKDIEDVKSGHRIGLMNQEIKVRVR